MLEDGMNSRLEKMRKKHSTSYSVQELRAIGLLSKKALYLNNKQQHLFCDITVCSLVAILDFFLQSSQ